MRQTLTLVKLRADQVSKAKESSGAHKQITYALVCGTYGQLFGTEKFCRKYFSVWLEIFPLLFDQSAETDDFDFQHFESTPELVSKLIEHHDAVEEYGHDVGNCGKPVKQVGGKSFWRKLLGL